MLKENDEEEINKIRQWIASEVGAKDVNKIFFGEMENKDFYFDYVRGRNKGQVIYAENSLSNYEKGNRLVGKINEENIGTIDVERNGVVEEITLVNCRIFLSDIVDVLKENSSERKERIQKYLDDNESNKKHKAYHRMLDKKLDEWFGEKQVYQPIDIKAQQAFARMYAPKHKSSYRADVVFFKNFRNMITINFKNAIREVTHLLVSLVVFVINKLDAPKSKITEAITRNVDDITESKVSKDRELVSMLEQKEMFQAKGIKDISEENKDLEVKSTQNILNSDTSIKPSPQEEGKLSEADNDLILEKVSRSAEVKNIAEENKDLENKSTQNILNSDTSIKPPPQEEGKISEADNDLVLEKISRNAEVKSIAEENKDLENKSTQNISNSGTRIKPPSQNQENLLHSAVDFLQKDSQKNDLEVKQENNCRLKF